MSRQYMGDPEGSVRARYSGAARDVVPPRRVSRDGATAWRPAAKARGR